MGQIIVKDDLIQRLRAVATERAVPLEQQTEEIIREGLSARRKTGRRDFPMPKGRGRLPADARALMESIAAMTPPGAQKTDSVELLRQDRDR